jgi:hypothetical protein
MNHQSTRAVSAHSLAGKFLAELPCCYAGTLLRLIDNGVSPFDAPSHLREALAFALSAPKIARCFLVQKMWMYDSI